MLRDEIKFTYISYDESVSEEIVIIKKVLVDWLFEIGERFDQSNLTVHIAVSYLERAF